MTTEALPSHHGPGQDQGGQAFANDTIRLLFERASCRRFEDRAIPDDVMRTVLEAGVHAPTGGNLQPYSIIQITAPDKRQDLAARCGQSFVAQAPVLLLFCLDLRRLQRWAALERAPFTATRSFRHFWISFQDVLICAQSVCTAADAMGLGSVYIGTVLEFLSDLRVMLDMPEGVFPVVLVCLGYPKVQTQPRRKLGIEAVVHSESYHEMTDSELLQTFAAKYQDQRIKVTPERLETIKEVCLQTQGEDLAEACLSRIQDQGYISTVQRYFGLHYRADQMPLGNNSFLEAMEEAGLCWFRSSAPSGDTDA